MSFKLVALDPFKGFNRREAFSNDNNGEAVLTGDCIVLPYENRDYSSLNLSQEYTCTTKGGVLYEVMKINSPNSLNYKYILFYHKSMISNLNELIEKIYKYFKKESFTIVVPFESFLVLNDPKNIYSNLDNLYAALANNMKHFATKSSISIIATINPILDQYSINDNSVFKLDLKKIDTKYNLNIIDTELKQELQNSQNDNPILNNMLINHLFSLCNETDSVIDSENSVTNITDLINKRAEELNIKKLISHVITPTALRQFKTDSDLGIANGNKTFIYRLALVLGLSFSTLLQMLTMAGLSFTYNDSLDIAIINYYLFNEEISEWGFIKYVARGDNQRARHVLNRLSGITSLRVIKNIIKGE